MASAEGTDQSNSYLFAQSAAQQHASERDHKRVIMQKRYAIRTHLIDGDVVEGSEFPANSFVITDAVMKPLSSSLTALHVLGATGSSEPRRKSI